MQTKASGNKPKIQKKDLIPILIFGSIVIILIITSNLTGRPPVIESMNRNAAEPGEEVIIYGNYFGEVRRGSKVLISGKSPPTNYYQEWSNKKISFILPEEMRSGTIAVQTDRGISKEIIVFLNKQDIPEKAEGPSKPGEPYITEIIPSKGTTGSVITLTGLNFGQDKSGSDVFFTWLSEDSKDSQNKDIFSSLTPGQDYDFDYVSWADREIKIRIPDGVSPGPLLISTDKGVSSPLYLEVDEPIGIKSYSSKRTYQLTFSIKIENINAAANNGLYIWFPRILEAPEQRGIKVIYSEPAPQLENYKGLMQYHFEELRPGEKYHAKVSYLFYRYTVETKLYNPYLIKYEYDESRPYLGQYTHASKMVPSTDRVIVNQGNTIRNAMTNQYARNNPYYVAQAIFNHVIKAFTFSNKRIFSSDKLPELLKSNTPEATSLDFAAYFCALARSQGIPARPVGGFLINENKESIPFYWAEFYIEKLGWVPVDPVLGSGAKPLAMELQEKDYYFGNVDNNHVALSKGMIEINQMDPRGKVITQMKTPSIQTIYEESTGNLFSYSTTWASLEDIGIY